MNAKIWVALGLTAVVAACSKDKFDTKPRLEFESFSSNPVHASGGVTVTVEFFDAEGDISDSIRIEKVRINKQSRPTKIDSFYYRVPDVSTNPRHGFIDINLRSEDIESAINPGTPAQPDSLILKITLKDKAKHTSDTLRTPLLVKLRS